MMRRLFLCLLFVLVANVASAQTDSYLVRYYGPGAITPFMQTDSFLISAATCNQAAPATTNTVNPTRIIFDDPAVAGRVCIYVLPASAALFTLANPGNYEGSIAVTTSAGTSAESARAFFSRAPQPPVPTGLKITR